MEVVVVVVDDVLPSAAVVDEVAVVEVVVVELPLTETKIAVAAVLTLSVSGRGLVVLDWQEPVQILQELNRNPP